MEQIKIQVEILEQLKLLVAITQQNNAKQLNDTFSIKSQDKAAKILGVCREKLINATKTNKIKKGIHYRKTNTGRYYFSDYIEIDCKGKI